MKTILSRLVGLTVVLVTLFSQVISASPLVFKVSKTVTSREFVELGSFDASKFSRLRVGLKVLTPDGKLPLNKETADLELARARRDFNRTETLFKDGLVSKSEFDSASERFKNAQEMAESSFSAEIVGVVGEEEIHVLSIDQNTLRTSIVIDAPPSLLRIKVKGKGTFSFFAWANA